MHAIAVSTLFLWLAATPSSPADAKNPCAYDRAAALRLKVDPFDQDFKGGWRALADKKGCELAAADLIAAYRKKHSSRLAPGEVTSLLWHEGQMRAVGKDAPGAVRLMLASVPPDDDPADMADYVLGTVAFLLRDPAALQVARDRLAKVPKPEWFDKMRQDALAQGVPAPTWPVNLEVLDGFIACWDKPYAEAYAIECRPASPKAP